MDALEFINSPDIREHLRAIHYKFTPLQCAYLVYASKRHTCAQKWAAWEDIIHTMPDCPVPERINCAGWDSLHEMLQGYIQMEKKYFELFSREGNPAVYYFSTPDDDGCWEESCDRIYTNERDCYRAACDWIGEDRIRMRITKRFVDIQGTDPQEVCLSVSFNEEGEAAEIDIRGFSSYKYENGKTVFPLEPAAMMTEDEDNLYSLCFDGMWFDFPTPFKRGDLVRNCLTNEPFVLMDMSYWRKRNPKKDAKRVEYYFDSWNMSAFGYSYDEERHFLYDDYMVPILDCAYYRGELQGEKKVLAAFSLHEQGEIDTWTLLSMYRMIRAEHQAERETSRLRSFVKEEYLQKIGIETTCKE